MEAWVAFQFTLVLGFQGTIKELRSWNAWAKSLGDELLGYFFARSSELRLDEMIFQGHSLEDVIARKEEFKTDFEDGL